MCRFRRPRDRGRYLEPASYISLRALHEMTRLRFERVFAACAAHDTELFTYSASTSVRAALLGGRFPGRAGRPDGHRARNDAGDDALGRVLLGADWLERWRRSDASVPGDVSADHRAAFAARIPRLAQFWSTGEQAWWRAEPSPGCPPPVTAPGCRSARLEGHHVLRSRALLALHHVELDLGALAKRLVTLALDGAVMTEDVLAAVVTGDEAEALVVGEPLDRSCRTHCRTPLVVESPECDAAFVCLMRNFRATRLRGNPSRSGGSPKVGGPFGGPSNERLQLRFADPV